MNNKKGINRRVFIKNSALAGLASMVTTAASADVLSYNSINPTVSINNEKDDSKRKFFYNKNGKFKILQLTDTHYIANNIKSDRAVKNVNEVIEKEKPDLIIHTGDIIFGKPAKQSMLEIIGVINQHKIPFAVAFGNHDTQYGMTGLELLDVIKTFPYNVSTTEKGISGASNCTITLSSSKSNKIERVFYLFDSHSITRTPDIGGYGMVKFDQIAWYRKKSEKFTKMNNGKPIPSFAFFHIPLPEMKEGANDDKNGCRLGFKGETVASPIANSGLFVSMKEMGDVDATFVGHDHNSDFALYWRKMLFFYGRFSGCDTVYNDLKPNGARIIELTEGVKGFRSWIRLYGGKIIQDYQYPDIFKPFDK